MAVEETVLRAGDISRWPVATPAGDKYVVAVAPRGLPLYYNWSGSDGDLGAELLAFVVQGVVVLALRHDETWKVGLFRAGRLILRRCVSKQTGLTEAEALREAERLRACARRGDVPERAT